MKKIMCVLFILSCVYTTSNSFDPESPEISRVQIRDWQNRVNAIDQDIANISNEKRDLYARITDLRRRSSELIHERSALLSELEGLQ